MGFAKGIKKIFGGGTSSSSNKAATALESGGHVVNENAMVTANTGGAAVNMAAIDTKKAEKAQKKALKKIAKKGGKAKHVSTSFPSSPNSAEIRIPGKPYVPASNAKSPATAEPSPANNNNVLGENKRAMNGASPSINTSSNSLTSSMPKSSMAAKNSEGDRFFASPVASQKNPHHPPSTTSDSRKYFGDDDHDDDENENNTTPNGANGVVQTQPQLTKQYLTQFAAANANLDAHATPPQHKNGGYLISTDTPASSSDFCLSTDVEDDEYNMAKQYYQSNALLMPESSNSTEEESTLFGGAVVDDDQHNGGGANSPETRDSNDGALNKHPQTLAKYSMDSNGSSHVMKTFGAKPGAGLFPDSSDSELDGEDMLPSPQSTTASNNQKSGGGVPSIHVPSSKHHHKDQSNESRATGARSEVLSPLSPLPRHPSHNRSRQPKPNMEDDGFGFQDFVVNAWPDQDASKTKNNIISFDNAFDQDPFAAAFGSSSGNHGKKKESHHRSRKSGGSVSSMPAVDPKPSSGRRGPSSSARGSRSVAPMSSSRSSSYRASPGHHTNHSQMLDKLEKELREKHAQGGSSMSHSRGTGTPRRHRRNRSNPVTSPLANGSSTADNTSDEDRKDPDGWLMHEVTDALGPKQGDGADMISLSGRSTRSKADRSVSGRSHKSRSANGGRRQPSSSRHHKHHSSSGASVASRNSHYSQRSIKSHMSEASKSVANDLMRLEVQLALVGKGDSGSVADLVSAAQSVGGGGSIAGGSVRSRRTTRSKSSRASPSSGSRNRRTVTAPPGKLGLILANKPDGRGTVVSGVRPTSALVDKVAMGDRIVAVDGEDVSHMNVSELTTIMTRKSDFDRKLTIISFPQPSSSSSLSGGTGLPHARAR